MAAALSAVSNGSATSVIVGMPIQRPCSFGLRGYMIDGGGLGSDLPPRIREGFEESARTFELRQIQARRDAYRLHQHLFWERVSDQFQVGGWVLSPNPGHSADTMLKEIIRQRLDKNLTELTPGTFRSPEWIATLSRFKRNAALLRWC